MLQNTNNITRIFCIEKYVTKNMYKQCKKHFMYRKNKLFVNKEFIQTHYTKSFYKQISCVFSIYKVISTVRESIVLDKSQCYVEKRVATQYVPIFTQ